MERLCYVQIFASLIFSKSFSELLIDLQFYYKTNSAHDLVLEFLLGFMVSWTPYFLAPLQRFEPFWQSHWQILARYNDILLIFWQYCSIGSKPLDQNLLETNGRSGFVAGVTKFGNAKLAAKFGSKNSWPLE